MIEQVNRMPLEMITLILTSNGAETIQGVRISVTSVGSFCLLAAFVNDGCYVLTFKFHSASENSREETGNWSEQSTIAAKRADVWS